MSDSLRLHGLKHTRLPCPSLFFLGLLKLMSIVMYRCESWTVKKAEHRRIDAFELRCWRRLWRVPLVLWPPDAKSQLIRKNPDAGKDWRQEEKGITEGKMVGWHHWLHGHEFEHTPWDGEGDGCSPWGCKESNMTERLNNSNKCPLSQWCHPTISSSVAPFSSCPQSFSSILSPTHQLRCRIQVEPPCPVVRVLLPEPRKCSRSLGIHKFTF